jgi:hypothetical protein
VKKKDMKKNFIIAMGLMLANVSEAQFIHGSIQKGTGYNQVDVLFRPTFNSNAGEYINYVQFSLTIPIAAYNAGVTATLVPVGNFATLAFAQGAQYTQASTNERVFTWVCVNPAITVMSWLSNTPFIGATVTFTGGPNNTQIRMADYSNAGGGSNVNTFFVITCTQHGPFGDVTDYSNFFYAHAGATTNTYPNLDQHVQTVQSVSLPVDILSFSGYKSGTTNKLQWTTSSEQNNRGFEVQRSMDGVNYNSIGFINSLATGGSSATQLDYDFIDNNVTGDRQYYRLRMVSLNNSSKLSNIVLIKGDKPVTLTINGLFPNPANSMVNVLIGAPGHDKVTLLVTDMLGKTVVQHVTEVETGSNTIPIDINVLANGSYIVKLICSSNCETTVGKFVKQ